VTALLTATIAALAIVTALLLIALEDKP